MNWDRIIFYFALLGFLWLWTVPEDKQVHTVPERVAKRVVL